ncbi:MAG: beta-ketoacyl synthase chain length factor [Burkholderiaceae bacterium]|nr:beta-ketoacyl synthase chain length factor [Burkholderiaceae bacterium]
MKLYVAGIGVWTPDLPGWSACRARLRDGVIAARATSPPGAAWLPPTERRRATLATRVVLTVAQEALTAAGWEAAQVASVFASSSGSPEITDQLCQALAAGDTQISPTRFHNSVHNAAAGYYAIAVGCREPSTSVAAFDASAAAGLLEAAALAIDEDRPVLFCAFDMPYSGALALVRPVVDPWGVALALVPQPAPTAQASLTLKWRPEPPADETRIADAVLEQARRHNPSARLLPLLSLLARRQPGTVTLAATPHAQLALTVEPC